jgi:hypothetical protein
MTGCPTVYAWNAILRRCFGHGEPTAWHVGLNRVACDRFGGLSEPHPETSYARIVVPNDEAHWIGTRLNEATECRTAWQNRTSVEWTMQPDILDKWLPIYGWTLFDPDGTAWFSADLPFPIDETTYDGPIVRLRPGDIFVAGVWLGGGVAYWEAV